MCYLLPIFTLYYTNNFKYVCQKKTLLKFNYNHMSSYPNLKFTKSTNVLNYNLTILYNYQYLIDVRFNLTQWLIFSFLLN